MVLFISLLDVSVLTLFSQGRKYDPVGVGPTVYHCYCLGFTNLTITQVLVAITKVLLKVNVSLLIVGHRQIIEQFKGNENMKCMSGFLSRF